MINMYGCVVRLGWLGVCARVAQLVVYKQFTRARPMRKTVPVGATRTSRAGGSLRRCPFLEMRARACGVNTHANDQAHYDFRAAQLHQLTRIWLSGLCERCVSMLAERVIVVVVRRVYNVQIQQQQHQCVRVFMLCGH